MWWSGEQKFGGQSSGLSCRHHRTLLIQIMVPPSPNEALLKHTFKVVSSLEKVPFQSSHDAVCFEWQCHLNIIVSATLALAIIN